jgi:hypothetical protein
METPLCINFINFMHLFLMLSTTQMCMEDMEVKPKHCIPQVWKEVTGHFVHEGRPQYHSVRDQVGPRATECSREDKACSAPAGNQTIANQFSDWASVPTWTQNTKNVDITSQSSSVGFEWPHSWREAPHSSEMSVDLYQTTWNHVPQVQLSSGGFLNIGYTALLQAVWKFRGI